MQIIDQEEERTMQIGAQRTKNVLILMNDLGGGHRASAEAIRDAFHLEFGDKYRVFLKDVWKECLGWPWNDLEGANNFLLKHGQLKKVLYDFTSLRWVHTFILASLAANYAKEVEAGLMEYNPDIIISVHPFMQHISLKVLTRQSLQKKVIFVTVITDLNTCHRAWFHSGVNRLYSPSQEVAKTALLHGLKESQIRVFALPIRPSFCRAILRKDDLRVELEMDPQLPAVLLTGGGQGLGPLEQNAKALGETLFDEQLAKPIGQMIIVCGRNNDLASSLGSIEWKIPVKAGPGTIAETQMEKWMGACDCIITKAGPGTIAETQMEKWMGACDCIITKAGPGTIAETQMEKWMGACDCIITKAGPGTIAEALIRGLPIILNDYIPGQEEGNVPYVVDNGVGVFSRSPEKTAKLVAEWFTTKTEELKKMSENALQLAQPNAVFDIVKDIHELACQRGTPGQHPQ